MIWADRIALVFAFLCLPLIVVNIDPDRAFGVSLSFTLAIWFMLRALDFIATGHIRRA